MEKTKAHCNACQGERNHEILFTEGTSWSDDEMGYEENDTYEMLKCLGCDRVILRHTSQCSGDPEPTVRFYPPAMSRRQPVWSLGFRINPRLCFVRRLLNEIYVGIQNDAKMSATMGVRALLEHVIIDSVGDQGTFSKNLEEFVKKGFIGDNQRVILETVLETGHATIHRSYQPSDADLQTCVDIAETVLQTLYVHPGKAAQLSKKVPKRGLPHEGK